MPKLRKTRDLVSVIVPIYNVEQYLDRCIKTIRNQTYKNLEIILVDDGSSDSCGTMCDTYKKKDKRIQVVHKKNGGLSSARNAGLDIAKGDFIYFVDPDDWIELNTIDALLEEAHNTQADIVVCDYYLSTDTEDKKNSYPKKQFILTGKDKFKYISDTKTIEYYGVVSTVQWNKLFRKEIFSKLRYDEGKMHEDEFIIAEELALANTVSYILKPLYHYYQREKSIMHVFSPNRLDSIEALNRRIAYFEKNDLKEYVPSLKFLKAHSLMRLYFTYFKDGNQATSLLRQCVSENRQDIESLYKEKIKLRTKIKLFIFIHFRVLSYYLFRKRICDDGAVFRRQK